MMRKAGPRNKVRLALSVPIVANPTPGETVGVNWKRNDKIASVGKTLKSARLYKLVMIIITLPGICRLKSWYERVICMELTIDHIYAIEPESTIWTTTFPATEDCPKFFKLSEATLADSIAFPRITCGGKSLMTVLRGSSVSAPVAKVLKYLSAGGRIVITNLSSEPGLFEMYSGSSKTNCTRISVVVILIACQLK
jgi:hypothetical protein